MFRPSVNAPAPTESAERAARVDEDEEEDDSYADQGHSLFETSEARADLFEARLNVLERRGDSEAFLTQATRAGRHARAVAKLIELKRVKEALKHAKAHFSQAEDAHVCAQQLQALGHTDDALALGELGLTLDGQKAQLGVWLGPLEEKCGRKTQALAA